MVIASKVQNLVLTEGLPTSIYSEDGSVLISELGDLIVQEVPANPLAVAGW